VSQARSAVELYWLPLGAGGTFVRMNGRIYEALAAWRGKRPRCDLYHSALVVIVPEGSFVIEQAWPIPRGNNAERGVVSEGPVCVSRAGRVRFLRYEIRRWRNGVIADMDEAVDSPQLLTDDPAVATRLLALVPEVPTPVWGRDELGTGEMWNSNSLVSWLLLRAGIDVGSVAPPRGGRAPGWHAGLVVASAGGANPRALAPMLEAARRQAQRGGSLPLRRHPPNRDRRGADRVARGGEGTMALDTYKVTYDDGPRPSQFDDEDEASQAGLQAYRDAAANEASPVKRVAKGDPPRS
jgi:hypothetical protein